MFLAVMTLILLDRYGIVNQWPLEVVDPACLLADHMFNFWIPVFPSGQYPECLGSLPHKGVAFWEGGGGGGGGAVDEEDEKGEASLTSQHRPLHEPLGPC